jgi:hypothetical protein
MGKLVVDVKIVVKCHHPQRTVLANLNVLQFPFELVFRRSEDFHKFIEMARANPIELSVTFAGAINLVLGVDVVKEHIVVQHELGYGVAVLANNILTVLLQYAANLREVIGIGVEFGFPVLRLHLRGQTPHKKCNEYCAHSLFIHMAFSFREMRRYFIGEKSSGRM